jgi:hypothetical protein
MTNRDTDTRTCTLVDVPLIHRISEQAVVLDTEIGYTRDLYGANGVILSSVLLPQRHSFTLLARSDRELVVGQFRIHQESVAHIVYLAPNLGVSDEDAVWLHVLDAMAREAGRQNAQMLVGEVDEDSLLFETMRYSGFAVYARQQIWRHMAGDYIAPPSEPITLAEVQETDFGMVQGLMARIVPSMLHPVVIPNNLTGGWVYKQDERVMAYIGVSTGRNGIYLMPFIAPDIADKAASIFYTLIQNLQGTDKLPLYVRVRRYQDWITGALNTLGFEAGTPQALMVRHIKAQVRQSRFELAKNALKIVPNLIPMDATGGQFNCQHVCQKR